MKTTEKNHDMKKFLIPSRPVVPGKFADEDNHYKYCQNILSTHADDPYCIWFGHLDEGSGGGSFLPMDESEHYDATVWPVQRFVFLVRPCRDYANGSELLADHDCGSEDHLAGLPVEYMFETAADLRAEVEAHT